MGQIRILEASTAQALTEEIEQMVVNSSEKWVLGRTDRLRDPQFKRRDSFHLEF